MRHDSGIGMFEEGKQRNVGLPFAYFGPSLGVRGEAYTNLLKGLVGLHQALSEWWDEDYTEALFKYSLHEVRIPARVVDRRSLYLCTAVQTQH